MIKEIATYIKTKLGTAYVIGENIFAGFAPDETEDCIIIIETGGVPRNAFLTDPQDKAIQIISRATDYHVAMAAAEAVYKAIHGQAGISLSAVEEGGDDYFVDTISAIALPQSLGQDEKGLFNISTNYVFKVEAA